MCLKQIAGLNAKSVENDPQNAPAIRNYILFLLYDLQDRTEKAYYDGKINDTQAADIISSIVDAKYTITRGQPKDSITAAVGIVKQKYLGVMPA
jgi:hypothetical protein